ncbi:type I polyketide synthase [Beijerinckia mobilis]|uniref:type I polyketide synthase n=1 Tax=Beijerinckia mobilis TaxID=231434 RepID=UPI00055992D5|nr:type I polyketide synthase [Beijerinckia mobilis]
METVIAITPNHNVDAQIAIAATKAGGIGILDLGLQDDSAAVVSAIGRLRESASVAGRWGIRWDTLGAKTRGADALVSLLPEDVPLIVLAGIGLHDLVNQLNIARQRAAQVFVEVCDQDAALAAQGAGYDGLIIKGHEAGGHVGTAASFILLQEVRGQIRIPYWIQGGASEYTAAAAILAGAAGVVLSEQLWLTQEGPFFAGGQKDQWNRLDGSETLTIGSGGDLVRLSSRHGRAKLREVELAIARGDDWRDVLHRHLLDRVDPLMFLGQDIAFAGTLGSKFITVGSVITALRDAMEDGLRTAADNACFAPDSALAKLHGTRFPIAQGPMTRVSDVAPFARAVAEGGGLPFLALAALRGPQVRSLLTKAKEEMGGKPWGVGILGFMPLDLRQEQMEAVYEVKPPFAVIAGGRPSQAKEMEELGITAYLHVPSPGLLRDFIKNGARRFIFEGSECGGHTGPRTSFILWSSAIDTLLDADIKDPEKVQVLFAGGIHDALSAAMVSVIAAPLARRGMKIGILMGTAYLFTEEAVRAGAIVQEFQDQAISCEETAVLQSGVGSYTRCAKTNFCDDFEKTRNQLLLEVKSENEILMELELLNIGRLRIASKGVSHNPKSTAADRADRYAEVDVETQRREGLYMMGEVARLRDRPVTIAQLHSSIADGSVEMLAEVGARQTILAPHKTGYRRPSADERYEDIAIVGMASVLPGSSDLRTYWTNIMQSVDSIREVPEDRWRVKDFYDPKRGLKDKIYSRWGGFLDDIAFDPTLYGIPPASLYSIDPMQILALHVAGKALEDAGFDRLPKTRERTATIFAVSGMNDIGQDYIFRTLLAHYLPKVEGLSDEVREQIINSLYDHALPKWTEDSFPGLLDNVVAGRVANRLDLRGANFIVDAACAASLAALDAGIRQLRSGDADAVLVGAVDGANNATGFMTFAQTHALSPRGRCRPFDDTADGIALGEGVAAVVLKRLADAERDGDKIYALIKGIGSSSDGHNRSLTAPDSAGQVRAVERAYADAGIDPATVTLIEAHGTGTALGDKSEITAMTTAFGAAGAPLHGCALGSVKSMIGHTKSTAGLAALVKSALALKQRVLPPTLNVEKPTTRVDFAQSPFYINSEARPWLGLPEGQPRRCGVSAFGFGGTNFHTVLEEYHGNYRASDALDLNPRTAELFAFGRSKRSEIEQAVKGLLQGLSESLPIDFAQLAYSVHLDETRFRPKNGNLICQLAVVAHSLPDLKAKLELFLREPADKTTIKAPQGVYYREETHRPESGAVCMLFSGQGSQRVNMLRELMVTRPAHYALFERADALLADKLPHPLSRYIYPQPSFSKEEEELRRKELNNTHVAQPALGVIDLTAFDILADFGVRPNFVAGHSYGEYAAACAAGVISRDDLIRLSEVRGRLSAEASAANSGTMAAVNAGEAQVNGAIKRLGLDVSIANLNAPDQTIIAGSAEAIDKAVQAFTKESVRIKPIPVTAAFHCGLMAKAGEALAEELAKVSFHAPKTPLYSNTTASPYPEEAADIQALLARHISEPLRFVDEIQNLYDAGARVFIEAGPGLVLTGLVDRILGSRPHVSLGVDAPERDGWLQLGHLLGQLFTLGLPITLEPWFQGRGLADVSVKQILAEARTKAQPSSMVWRVNGGRAVPWNQTAGGKPKPPGKPASLPGNTPASPPESKPAAVASAKPTAAAQGSGSGPVVQKAAATASQGTQPSHSPAAAPAAQPLQAKAAAAGPKPFIKTEVRKSPVPDHERPPANGVHSPPIYGPGFESRFSEVQGSLSQLIDLQRQQQVTLQRFFAFQENLLSGQPAHTSNGNGQAYPTPSLEAPLHEAPVLTLPPVESQLAAAAIAAPARIIVPPAPVLPNFVAQTKTVEVSYVAPVQNGAPAPVKAAANGAALNGAGKAQNGAVAPAGSNFPPAEQFKADLLAAVSERTGYTEDMLDLDAHMEADLGIDSIKRIEIFSKLKDQYPFMDGRAEETVFEELAGLKTLNAVVDWYDGLSKAAGASSGAIAAKKSPAPAILREAEESIAIATADPAHRAVFPAATNGAAVPALVKVGTPAASLNFAPTEQFKTDLLAAVAERTGYTEDMLDLDAHMEADLGIDSIKRIEIFSKLKDQYPFMDGRSEETVFEELAGLKTLNTVVEWYDSLRQSASAPEGVPPGKKSQTPSSVSLPETTESAESAARPEEVHRYTVNPVAAPREGGREMEGYPADRLILLIGDVPIVGALFQDRLKTGGYLVQQIVSGSQTRVLDADRIAVDFSSLESVGKLHDLIAAKGQKVGALFNLAGLGGGGEGESDRNGASHLDFARRLFLLLKIFESDLKDAVKAGGGWLVNLTAFDGQFGLRQTRAFPALHAGTLGVAKSVAREWPGVRVKCIDVDLDINPDQLVTEVLSEAANADDEIEVGFTPRERWKLDLGRGGAAAADLSALNLNSDSVLLVTGGANGITADITKALAEKFRPRLILVGRSPMPEDEPETTREIADPQMLKQALIRDLRAKNPKITPAEINRVFARILKDRQIRDNIGAMRAAGAQVEYHALDTRDGDAFAALIDSIYAQWGRIDGVLHGAGVIDDKPIHNKSPDSFETVFSTKVTPATVLVNKLRPEGLKFLVFFSSIAGRFGNAGQSDYSAANEVVNKIAGRLSHEWPHVHTIAINWGPWDGGMVNEDLRKLFASRNIHPIPIAEGRQYCLDEIGRGNHGKPEIVVSASLQQFAQLSARQ